MKITITVTATFAAAHRLPDHEGKCFRLHGHTYGLEVSVEGTPQETGPAAGMVMDDIDPMARHALANITLPERRGDCGHRPNR